MTYHWHHITPKHAGGDDSAENLVRVTIEEHAELHFARYLEFGDYGDLVAAWTLSGQISGDEARRLAAAEHCRNRVWTEESKEKIRNHNRSKVGRKNSPEARQRQRLAAQQRTTGNAVAKSFTCSNGKTYHSICEAAEDTGVGRGAIHRFLRGEVKKGRHGLSFSY